jgi:hypothetical protein
MDCSVGQGSTPGKCRGPGNRLPLNLQKKGGIEMLEMLESNLTSEFIIENMVEGILGKRWTYSAKMAHVEKILDATGKDVAVIESVAKLIQQSDYDLTTYMFNVVKIAKRFGCARCFKVRSRMDEDLIEDWVEKYSINDTDKDDRVDINYIVSEDHISRKVESIYDFYFPVIEDKFESVDEAITLDQESKVDIKMAFAIEATKLFTKAMLKVEKTVDEVYKFSNECLVKDIKIIKEHDAILSGYIKRRLSACQKRLETLLDAFKE